MACDTGFIWYVGTYRAFFEHELQFVTRDCGNNNACYTITFDGGLSGADIERFVIEAIGVGDEAIAAIEEVVGGTAIQQHGILELFQTLYRAQRAVWFVLDSTLLISLRGCNELG